jgi:hypothetical protein
MSLRLPIRVGIYPDIESFQTNRGRECFRVFFFLLGFCFPGGFTGLAFALAVLGILPGRGFPNPQLARAQGPHGTVTRLLRRFPGTSFCQSKWVGSSDGLRPNQLSAESELRAPALARSSRPHAIAGSWSADFQIRSWPERRGCLARALDLLGGSQSLHRGDGCRGGGFETLRANHLAAESGLRAPVLARRSRRHGGL